MSIYGILTTKYIRHSLHLLCLLYSPVGVSLIRIQLLSGNIFGIHFPLYPFSIPEKSRWSLSPSSLDMAPMFSGEKFQMGMQKMKFQ